MSSAPLTAIEKTAALGRVMLPVGKLFSNEKNPNKMSDKEFNLLCDNIERVGITDPIFVRAMDDGKYRIIGGHHRFEVAKLLDFDEVPCTVITDPNFSDDEESFQVMRHNMIRGKLDPAKFQELFHSLSGQYAEDVIAESFGFADEKEFAKVMQQMKKKLPKDMQAAFEEASKEVKTIDGLSKLLNKLFSDHGDSLPYGYMLIDFGQKDSIWLRMTNDTRKALLKVGDLCKSSERTMDDILGGVVQSIADGNHPELIAQLVAKSKPVVIPESFKELPTANNLAVS
ncbi:ParBc [Stenotrophomonas phage vB_SmaS_DLP_3]|nr:ParBc [Stenotrophomonas phage vB_SmaS_DLP_3]